LAASGSATGPQASPLWIDRVNIAAQPSAGNSKRFSTSAPSATSVARTALSSCATVREPMIGAVTAGLCSSQASATVAGTGGHEADSP
jgi:hypothetical protein